MIKLLAPADVVSLVNAGLGFLAVLLLVVPYVFSQEFHMHAAFSLILLAILADGLDGFVARRTRHGKLGEFLEAMADMTSLGIAPAVFVYSMYRDLFSSSLYLFLILVLVLLVFLVCGIIRLSSFHIIKEGRFFVGLPASASTIIIIVFAFLDIPLFVMLVLLVVVSLAMVSPVRFLKPGLRINGLAGLLIFLAIIFRHTFQDMFPLMLLVAVLVYIICGPVYVHNSFRQR